MKIVHSPYFVCICFFFILLNTVFLALESYYNKPSFNKFLKNSNKMFNMIFCAEMLIKLFALGIKGYMRDTFNIFDAFLVMVSMTDLILESLSGWGGAGGSGSVITVFRTLRLIKI